MKQVLPPGGFVQMVHTQEKTDSHALAQTVTTQSKDEEGHGVELPLYTKVESQTQLLNGKTA